MYVCPYVCMCTIYNYSHAYNYLYVIIVRFLIVGQKVSLRKWLISQLGQGNFKGILERCICLLLLHYESPHTQQLKVHLFVQFIISPFLQVKSLGSAQTDLHSASYQVEIKGMARLLSHVDLRVLFQAHEGGWMNFFPYDYRTGTLIFFLAASGSCFQLLEATLRLVLCILL